MRAISGLWRWRRNPLRRATDLAEAWTCLLALLLILVAGPVIGSATGRDAIARARAGAGTVFASGVHSR